MAKKGSSRKSLKSLFSRSEAHLDRSAERDANKGEGEKKRFKLFHFKRKSRGESLESLGAAEANNTAEDGEAWADNIVPDSKRPSRYATAPRSKGKEFSYSELDLRKPKRFATFSFGLRKRKKKDEENISKSTFGLHSSVIDEDGETTLDLSQVELDQGNVKTMFSMSQPELDTCQKFDIPSPPPAATNQSESHLTVPDQSRPLVTVNTQPESQGRPKGSDLADVHWDVPEAPIASIPELRLDDEEVGIPVYNKSTRRESPAPLTHGESVPVADTQAAPGLPARQPPGAHNAAADESARASPGPRDNDILQQSRTITETPPPESTGVPVSYHRPEAPDGADTATPGGERSPASVYSKADASITESSPAPPKHNDISAPSARSAAIISDAAPIPRVESSLPEAAQRAASPAGSSERRPRPYSQNVLYGALYDSLFPQSFTSEVMSSLPNPPPPIHTERRRLTSTKSEPVMVKTRDECHTETNVTYSRPSSTRDPAARRAQDAEGRPAADSKADASSESSGFSFSQSSAAADYQPDADIRHRYRSSSPRSTSGPVGEDSPYSELTRSLPEVKSDRCSLVRDAVPVVQNSAPPASDCVTSPGPETRVTDCKPRVILVKETVTDEASADSGCPAPVPDKMSAVDGLEIQIGATESFYAASGSGTTEGSDGLLSPAYLSVGSDDGSAMEVYYSAEENGAEESGDEEMYTMYEREDVRAAGGAHEMDWGETADRGGSKRDGGDFRVVTVQMRNEGGNTGDDEDKEEDLSGQTGAQQRPGGQAEEAPAREDLVSDDASRHERESAAAALPQITEEEEGEEEEEEEVGGRKEQVLATPVQLVNTVMVCEVAPPSGEPHVQGEWSEGNRTRHSETEDPLGGDKQLPGQGIRYPAHKDDRSSQHTRAAAETVSPSADNRETEDSIETSGAAVGETPAGAAAVVTGDSTRGAVLQSDATEAEHNRSLQSSEWAGTITESAGGEKRTAREQAAVELSAPTADAHRPDTEPAESRGERGERAAEERPDLNPGSDAATSEVLAPESQQTRADQESVSRMTSRYSGLSTKLTAQLSSGPREDESELRFHNATAEAGGLGADTADSGGRSATLTGSNGADFGSEHSWRNRFEGVTQYRPYVQEDSLTYRTPDSYPSSPSSSSALPEAAAYRWSSSCPSSEEHLALGHRLGDEANVHESEPAPRDEWRRSSPVQREEPAAPAGERERRREGEAERLEARWDAQQLPVSGFPSTLQTSHADAFTGDYGGGGGGDDDDDDDSYPFTGLFKATLVELVCEPAAPPYTPPASPDADSSSQFDMDNLVDTLKSMGPSLRPSPMAARGPPQVLVSSLPPIVEDSPSPVTPDFPASLSSPPKKMEPAGTEALNGMYALPPDLGLRRNSPRDTRSPLEMMKLGQQDQQTQPGARGLNLPLRASAANSIVMRKSSDSSPEDLASPVANGNGMLPTGSRLDNSVIFKSYRSSSIDQTAENGTAHRPLFRTNSLPDAGPPIDRPSGAGPKEFGDPAASRFERFPFLANSTSPSLSGSLTGAEDPSFRLTRPAALSFGAPPSSDSPTRLLSPTSSIDHHRPFTTTDSPFSSFSPSLGMGMGMGMGAGAGTQGPPILQRSFSSEGSVGVQHTSLFNSFHGSSLQQSKEPEPDKGLVTKYRAFPDAYLTKEKEHGKLNPRPGKMYIFDQPGMCGQRFEVRSDVVDATSWELQETISIRVVRGGWVLYEKPNFKGEKFALDEGDIELTNPFSPPEEEEEEEVNGQREAGEQNGDPGDERTESAPARRFIVGSLRRAVRDYSVPEISLFPEENAEGKKVVFRDTSDDARIFGFPVKATSIIINAGLWLVYAQPFFQGVPRVLEVGGYSNPAAWGVEQPYVGSLHPLKVGEPRVENTSEPKLVIHDKPYFCGKSRTITANMRDFMTRTDQQQATFMYNVGSLKVQGGIWVGYEKEGFRGHQYLLEEGDYQDWRVWGGRDAELRSVRLIRADLSDPLMVMFEQPEEEQEAMPEENTFEVTEAIPDVELFGYKTSTRSIHVLSGAWVAYSHVDFSGNQYILEKGFYNNSADWGSLDTRICSVQPILLAPCDNSRTRNEIVLYSEPDFQGQCHLFDRNQEAVSERFLTKSCRVAGGSWVLYDNKQYSGSMYVLHEGDYPNLTSMGCPAAYAVRSVKAVPTAFAVPSLSLFGLECLEGREITTETEILSMAGEGFNNHFLSVRVNSGCWVICEYSNYRGRQFFLEPIEITNWPKFSSLHTIGSVYPVKQGHRVFRVKNQESGLFLCVQGGVEEMKSGRVVVAAEAEPMSDMWFYQDGLVKSKLSQTMSLQVMGNIEPAAKVVLWTETRQPIQTWKTQMRGLITSLTFSGMVLDVKGGKTYDKDHVVIMPENDERPSQQWEIEFV
ncbi:uncharacterized protein LOC118292501 [Scophthalmus maximus]|uniref:uncharacterized protein LOC118292501 n=1 Tax=Scophthalmus maximus TaxID=52904 RepID=UPI001FA8ABF6|nr:uncharacterized protein LOC118292501 [Scophthalmus maximus]